MSALDAGRETPGIRGFRPQRVLTIAARSLVVALLLATGYVANYWALHWLMYRGWMSASGPDRVLSRVYRTPGDWYAASALPGARLFDHWKREWQRSGRRAYERAWQSESAERERRAILEVLAAQQLHQREQYGSRAGTTVTTGNSPTGQSRVSSKR